MIALDSNVWIYTLDADLHEHTDVAPAVKRLLSSDTTLFVNSVIRLEVVHYLVKNLESEVGSTDAEKFLNLEGVIAESVTTKDVTRATEILTEYEPTGIGGRDASLVATMEKADVSEIWTHDEGLKRVGDESDRLDVHDPVEDT